MSKFIPNMALKQIFIVSTVIKKCPDSKQEILYCWMKCQCMILGVWYYRDPGESRLGYSGTVSLINGLPQAPSRTYMYLRFRGGQAGLENLTKIFIVCLTCFKVFKVASPSFLCITLTGCAIMYLEVRL